MASSAVAGVKRSFAAMAADQVSASSQPFLARHGDIPTKRHRSQAAVAADHPSDYDSLSRSTSDSPPVRASIEAVPTRFEPDASIVLVGMRGSGKSTLAIIASTAMKRRIVDTEQAFFDTTGLSATTFKKTHGGLEYRRRQFGVLQAILTRYGRDSIIVSSWMGRSIQNLLHEFSNSHPVIHIVRDQTAIADYLGVTDAEKFRELLNYTASTFRACGSYEFFNVSETLSKLGDPTVLETTALDHNSEQKSPAPYLTLKRAERHFLRFLALIMPKDTIPYIESAFPLASIPTEKRQFTYAISAPLSELLSGSLKIEDLETGADAIEIVVDDVFSQMDQNVRLGPNRASQISRVFGHIRRNVVIPIIYNIIWPSQRPIDNTQKLLYLEHIQHGLRLAPEYIGLDLRLEDDMFSHVVESKKRSKVIGTVNMATSQPPSWKDPLWISYYRKARDLGCDLVRLLRPATQIEDNFEVSCLKQAVEELGPPALPLIAFNTGAKGRNSQCYNKILTSVIPESLARGSAIDPATSSYIPPAITALEATTALHSSFIIDAMKLYVVGANVDYSMSPAMHNTALKACGIPHVYQPYSTVSLSNIRELIHDPLFAGSSIGLPFKVEVISLTHSLSSHAKAIGAVNTLIPVRHLNSDGTIPENALFFNFRNRAGPVLALFGENTDWIGIRACIRRGLSPANAVRPSSSGLVVGAGGMARAAVYALLQLGVKNIAIFNRTPANAEKLVAHFTRLLSRDDSPLLGPSSDMETRFHVISTREEQWPGKFRLPTMIISCIPTHAIGDSPAPNFKLPPAWMHNPTGGVVVELGYRYLNTPLLNQVRAEAQRGWVPMDGLDLLPDQGFAQFELFTGRRAPRRLMREEVFRSYPNEHGESNQTQLQPRLDNIVEQEP
ncbi:shikimate dehydrogenase substrate binding domain-containing protein [Xylariales sp. AK1849]|nr:shikimate dehydrogenase substrate binding domain-containing protein [Xylariales sp. AK1849]